MNKYEMVMIAAREARRLNDAAKLAGRDLKRRPTALAWELLNTGRIKYTYSAEPLDAEQMAAEAAGGEGAPEEAESEAKA